MRRILTAVIAVLFVASAGLGGQSPGRSRDPAAGLAIGTARIAGRVVDAQTGLPVARARVRLEGVRTAAVATDDTGLFEFARLPACACAISVDKAGYVPSRYPAGAPTFRRSRRTLTLGDAAVLTDILVPLYRGGSIAGRIVDTFGEPVESARVQLLYLQPDGTPQPRGGASTDDLGEFRVPRLEPGRYLLFVEHRNQADDPNPLQPVPTFYPGVSDLGQAQPIAVERGQSITGLELPLLAGTTSWVSGTVIGEDGAPVTSGNGRGVFVSARRISGGTLDYGSFSVQVSEDGSFRAKMPPGDYEIEARASIAPVAGPPGAAGEQTGTVEVAVGGAPLSNLAVQLLPGATLTGRIEFEGARPPPGRGSAAETIAASFTPVPGGRCRRGGGQNQVERLTRMATEPDWSFRIPELFGTCVVSFTTTNLDTWSVTGVFHGDADILERPVTFQPGQVLGNVRVVVSDRPTQVTLRVSDTQGLPTRDYVAVVFSVDPSRWTATSRFLRAFVPAEPPRLTSPADHVITAAMTTADTLTGLPPGDYYVIAIDDIGFDAIRSPDVLARLAKSATRVEVSAGAPIRLELRRETLDGAMKR